jgi:Asp-tRNA(Asn)/Glu-tRNA(Gln) amidotransferase A subunit family amidase
MLARLAEAVRERTVSASELVRTALERIERLNPDLNAVTQVWADEALAQAEKADRRGAEGPLAGLPLLVKDNTDVAGKVTSYASRAMLDRPPAERSEVTVERMVAAGAIPIGRTNLPEFAFQGYTDSKLFGPARNPWGLDWSPGGSSGGSGAALAAGLAPIATAGDGGGSIRTPAAFCGLAGLKPTNGLVGRRPIPSWMDYSTQGPLAAGIEDVKLLLHVMRGPVDGDPTAAPSWQYGGGMPRRVLAALRTRNVGPLPEDVEEPFRASLGAIEGELGLTVEEISTVSLFPSLDLTETQTRDDWFATVAAEELIWLGRVWVKEHLDQFSDDFRAAMEYGLRLSLDDYLEVRQHRFAYASDLDRLLGEDTVLVTPTNGYAGWLPNGMLPDDDRAAEAEGYNTGEFNMSGHPALSVPAGLSANGIPFGLQIVGPRYRDDLVLEFGAAWQEARPWLATAPGYEPFPVP